MRKECRKSAHTEDVWHRCGKRKKEKKKNHTLLDITTLLQNAAIDPERRSYRRSNPFSLIEHAGREREASSHDHCFITF